jgi:AraC-like DNA-binding protein
MTRSAISYRPPRPGALLSVLEVGQQTVRSMIDRRTLKVFAAVLVESGGGTLETAPSGVQAVAAPSLLWLVPGLRHSYGPRPGTAWDERWILFTGRLADEWLTGGLLTPAAPVVALRDSSEVPRLFAELHAAAAMNAQAGDALAAGIVPYLVARARIEAPRDADQGTPGDAPIRTLRQEALQPLDLAAFAARFGMSPATLRRRVLAATGVPPKVFQLRLRIDRAKELLATTDRPIGQIATDVGFEDSFYFARLFLQREKCTPTEFRQRHYRR